MPGLKCHHYFAVHLIVVYKLFLLLKAALPPLQYTRYETLPFSTDYCSYYVSATSTARLYISHRNCIHVRTFHLCGGLVGDPVVVVSLSTKEQVYVSLIH